MGNAYDTTGSLALVQTGIMGKLISPPPADLEVALTILASDKAHGYSLPLPQVVS